MILLLCKKYYKNALLMYTSCRGGYFSSVKKLTEYLRVGYVTLYGVSETKVNARTRYVYTL